MVKLSEYRSSGYLKADDIKKDTLVEIEDVTVEEIGEKKEEKVVVHFVGMKAGLVLNNTTSEFLEQAFGPDADAMIGSNIVLYNDPTIRFGGKKTGGVRIRLPKKTAAPTGSTADQLDDAIPF